MNLHHTPTVVDGMHSGLGHSLRLAARAGTWVSNQRGCAVEGKRMICAGDEKIGYSGVWEAG